MAKVLIVDDSSLMRAVLKNFVKSEGHEVIEAAEGEEAIRKYTIEKPDVVFLDILMPNGLDGMSALKEIKQIDPASKVIMITSVREEKEFSQATELGVKFYINKPFSREEVVTALKESLKK